jgi:hypothetical protein
VFIISNQCAVSDLTTQGCAHAAVSNVSNTNSSVSCKE